ncbi:head GIN domain-containing protein [Cellulophaga sp. L1A9]|uniref:head GIN domain-containing protein n=1 Tax=Cellulophaga sp. L1A9 TaxID=2686362 RepID=UPI00131DD978|nr:head GIN domain-containing protein [Cellulophaga sp. L1A9]
MKNLLIAVLSLLTITSCSAQWGKKIKGNGVFKTIERTTDDYDSVSISGWFDVDLVDGNEGKITITGEENLLEYIITEIKDGQLVIKVEDNKNLQPSKWKNSIKIIIPVEEIEALSLSGSGDVVGKKILKTNRFAMTMSGSGDISLSLDANTISATMSGSGDMELKGSTDDFKATISGSGNIKAYELKADNVKATISGSADMQVVANRSLKAQVSGSGDISYRGNPDKINTKISGSGSISKR